MTANKQATLTKRGPAPRALGPLIAEVRSLIQAARHAAASTVNTLQVRTNFEIGRRIVEHEQKGTKRAEYGAQLLNDLATRLTEEFGKGFSARNLRSFRSFFQTYRERVPKIWQKPSAKLPRIESSPKTSVELGIADGEPHHRHIPVQTKKGCHRRDHPAARCQHPRQGIQALLAVEG